MAGVNTYTGHPVIIVVVIVIVAEQIQEARNNPEVDEISLMFFPAFINEDSK